MELPQRSSNDVFLRDGVFSETISRLRGRGDGHDLRIGIVYTFDFRTRMLPYWYADKRMAPCSVRTLGDVLDAAGFRHIRIILQQWTPNFRPSSAILDGRPLDLLLVSAMQVHAEASYKIIRDAHLLGEQRPLILAGGPKAIYEPTDYFELDNQSGIGADCVVTGEVFVLLELLETILNLRSEGQSIRTAFDRARRNGDLDDVPGLVFLSPDSPLERRWAINTGPNRLLRDLDEMPMPDAGYRLIEPPHRGRCLKAKPYSPKKVGKYSILSSIISTQGCKFNCSYCPIPAVNQRTWRYKSPKRFADEIKHVYEKFGISQFFGTDDNFFNRRSTVTELMSEMSQTTTGGVPLGECIRFYTEGTQFDVYKNRDLLPLCWKGGMRAIWFGIEDITAELVNKGQTEDKTVELFNLLNRIGIEAMAMMIHSDDQPLRSKPGDLSGLLNQADYLYNNGALSYQCTYLGPAVGTRDFETAAKARIMYQKVGGKDIPQPFYDGNHVAASRHAEPWERQINIIRAYARFYNPWNMFRLLPKWRKDPLFSKRILFQIIGQIGIVMTAPKLYRWARKLKRGPIEMWDGLQPARIPMVDVKSGQEISWAIGQVPAKDIPPVKVPAPRPVRFPQSTGTFSLPILSPAVGMIS